jgi:hypothetical protein
MKKYIILVLILCAVGGFYSCEEVEPLERQANQGGILAEVAEVRSGLVNIGDIDNAVVDFTLDVTEATGMQTQEVIVFSSLNGEAAVEAGRFSSFPSDIQLRPDDLLRGSGLSPTDLGLGDNFLISFVAISTSGESFTSSNTLPATVACSFGNDFAVGTYLLEETMGSPDPFFGGQWFSDGLVELSVSGTNQRTFSTTFLTIAAGEPITFELLCENIIVPTTLSTLGCAGEILTFQTAAQPGQIDISDDGTININMVMLANSNCGSNETELSYRLTKQ